MLLIILPDSDQNDSIMEAHLHLAKTLLSFGQSFLLFIILDV